MHKAACVSAVDASNRKHVQEGPVHYVKANSVLMWEDLNTAASPPHLFPPAGPYTSHPQQPDANRVLVALL